MEGVTLSLAKLFQKIDTYLNEDFCADFLKTVFEMFCSITKKYIMF